MYLLLCIILVRSITTILTIALEKKTSISGFQCKKLSFCSSHVLGTFLCKKSHTQVKFFNHILILKCTSVKELSHRIANDFIINVPLHSRLTKKFHPFWSDSRKQTLFVSDLQAFSFLVVTYRRFDCMARWSYFCMTLESGFGKCLLFVLSANGWKDQNMDSFLFCQRNLNVDQALFDWPTVLQYDVKIVSIDFKKFLGHEVFWSNVLFNNQSKAMHNSIHLTNQSNRSISICLLFLFCSCVFISRSYENHSIVGLKVLLFGEMKKKILFWNPSCDWQ